MVRKRELAIGASILIIATSAYLFGWTNLFTVKKIEIKGAPDSQFTNLVMKISEIERGQKMARVEPRSIEGKLKQSGIGWLEQVDISRNWLSGEVSLNLKPRKAVAKSGDRYVDIHGVLFDLPRQLSSGESSLLANLPELSGADDQSRASGLDLYLKLPADFQSNISKITAKSQENFQFLIGEKLRINWGNSSDLAVKVKIYKALIALPENNKITSMDLSNPTKPSVK